MVIPAITGGTGNQMTEYPDGADPATYLGQAEALTAEQRKEAAVVIDAFGEPLVQKLLSKTWQLRDDALGEIEEIALAQGKRQSEPHFLGTVGAVSFTVGDRNANVIQKAAALLQTAAEVYHSVSLDGTMRADFNQFSEVVLGTLAEKVGDALQKIRQSAEDALISAAGHPQFGVKAVLNHLTADVPFSARAKAKGGKKPVLPSKQLKHKYELLFRLLQSYPFSHDQQVTAVRFAVKGLQHAQADVRGPATDCMGELYK